MYVYRRPYHYGYHAPVVYHAPMVYHAPVYGWYHPYYRPMFIGGAIPMWSVYSFVGVLVFLCILSICLSMCYSPIYGGGGYYGGGYVEPVIVADPMMMGPGPMIVGDPMYGGPVGYGPSPVVVV